MIRRLELMQPFAGERERCPECRHIWNEVGPAHFTDCRYFSLDDDRDEETATLRGSKHRLLTEEA